jgi:hypothetical protein
MEAKRRRRPAVAGDALRTFDRYTGRVHPRAQRLLQVFARLLLLLPILLLPILLLPILLLPCLGGCGAGPARTDVADVAPGDLIIEATVLTGRGAERLDRVERRQGRYILFPDGGLHADVGRTVDVEVRPGLTRRLERQQVAALWLVARETGLASPGNGEPAANDALVTAQPGEVVHIITFIGENRSWRFVRMAPGLGEQDPATTRLIRELAALAWVPDDPSAPLRPAVVRYDFGPDPYAMYRAPATSRALPKPFFWAR